MTYICKACGEMVEENWIKFEECTRCGVEREPDKEGRKKLSDAFERLMTNSPKPNIIERAKSIDGSEECKMRRHDLCSGKIMAGFDQVCGCCCHD